MLEDLLRIINMATLEHKREQRSLTLLYKCVNNNGPRYIKEFFLALEKRNTNLRGNGINLCTLN